VNDPEEGEQQLRILVVSNFYPPYHIGGYELGCRDAVEALKTRGHEVKVLTSTYGLGQSETDGQVYRWLQTHIDRDYSTAELSRKELQNGDAFKRIVEALRPEVISVWNLWQISSSFVLTAQQMGLPVCYYVFDHWFSGWGKYGNWFGWWDYIPSHPMKLLSKQLLDLLLSTIRVRTQTEVPDFRHAQFASQFLKQKALQAGKPVTQAKVIHWGVDIEHFPYRNSSESSMKRLLYVGQLVRHKGVHTAVEALKLLVEKYGYQAVEFTIVGGTIIPDYETDLKKLVRSFGLEKEIHLTGPLPRERLPSIYQEHDVMIVPSIWDEPFGITILEAMSSGLAVVGTATGGSAEILQHGFNGLVFPKKDAQTCAAQILRLLENRDLFERVRLNGRQTVEQKFRIERTMDMVEQALQEAVSSNYR
jgi:glycogen(starch) synthase